MKIRIVAVMVGIVNLMAGMAWLAWANPAAGDGMVIMFSTTAVALGSMLVVFRKC